MRTGALLPGLLLVMGLTAPARAQLTLGEFDPLVIRAPRYKIPKGDPIDPQINAHLMRLLRERAEARPESAEALAASLGNLNKLTTATGYKLKVRYTELGFLLTEGLAGVKDFGMQNELERIARMGLNLQTRAAAMVALAYTKDLRFMPLFQGALNDPNITVRFAAMESLLILGDAGVRFIVSNAARGDLFAPIRLYGAQGMWKMGDPDGEGILVAHYQDRDWFVRALATQYLGEKGGRDTFDRLMQQLSLEENPAVKAELCSALLRILGRK